MFFMMVCFEVFYFEFTINLPPPTGGGLVQRTAVWLVADFEALSYQVTTTFDTSCAARIRTAPAINYTAC